MKRSLLRFAPAPKDGPAQPQQNLAESPATQALSVNGHAVRADVAAALQSPTANDGLIVAMRENKWHNWTPAMIHAFIETVRAEKAREIKGAIARTCAQFALPQYVAESWMSNPPTTLPDQGEAAGQTTRNDSHQSTAPNGNSSSSRSRSTGPTGAALAVIEKGLLNDEAFSRRGNLPMLTLDEERKLVARMIDERSEWRRALLRHPTALQLALATYRNTAKSGNKNKTILMVAKDASHADAVGKLREKLPEIERLVGLVDSSASGPSEHIDTLMTLLEEHPLRAAYLERIERNIRRLLRQKEQSADGVISDGCREYLGRVSETGTAYRKSRDHLILANMGLAGAVARDYRNPDISYRDLAQIGELGLIRATETFDPAYKCKFGTYATWWIRQNISRAVADESKDIRIPVNIFQILPQARVFLARYKQEHGKSPPPDIVQATFGVSLNSIKQALRVSRRRRRLDAPFSPGSEDAYGSTVEDETAELPQDNAYRHERWEAVVTALRSLSKRERFVINRRFGLGVRELPRQRPQDPVRFAFDLETYGVSLTLDEVSLLMKTNNEDGAKTKERVRQIEAKALKKLQNTDHPLRHGLVVHGTDAPHAPVESFASGNDPRLALSLSELPIDLRTVNLLEDQGIFSVGDYIALDDGETSTIRNFGEVRRAEVERAIARLSGSGAAKTNGTTHHVSIQRELP